MTKNVEKQLFKQAAYDPAALFSSPYDLVNDPRFSQNQKIRLLKSWAWDIQELLVAEDENMVGGNDSSGDLLEDIQCALGRLS